MSGEAKRQDPLARVLSLKSVRWFELDWHVALLALALAAIGMVHVHSIAEADELHQRAGVDWGGHVQKLCVALPFFVLALAARARWLARNAGRIWLAAMVLMVLVFVVGDVRNGARRWIQLPLGFDLQPSELAKPALVLALAAALASTKLKSGRDWMRVAPIMLVPIALTALQPDLGTAMTMVPVSLGMLWAAGASWRLYAALFVGGPLLALLAAGTGFLLHDYQLQRVRTWLESWNAQDLLEAKNGAAFHAYHARVAIGNGGWTGTGLGEGVANRTAYLPERDCDSIFAVVAEEGGFVGALLVLLVYALFVVSLFGSASALRDRFSRLAVTGIAIYFGAHLVVNTGVNLGLVPLTGLTLPFFSTGGSSMLASWAMLGLALGLCASRVPTLDGDSFHRA
ncbi:MAG: FtsW/RodA/SpoVE family cell cycle protein [Planctomycetia bacterium]|jgi:rod shape determining protein RodA